MLTSCALSRTSSSHSTRPLSRSTVPPSRHRGFTIIELLLVIVVIAVLAVVVVVSYRGMQKRASLSVAQSSATNTIKQLELARAINGQFPTSISDCPTPTGTNLCLTPATGQVYSYFAFNPGVGVRFGSALHSTNPPAYEIVVKNSAQFYYYSTAEITSNNEFVQYTDMAPIIDQYGLQSYQISFDIKSANTTSANTVQAYMQNGSGAKYTFSVAVPVTTTYQRQTITVVPAMGGAFAQSILAFYGTYGTGNIVTVKNVQMSLSS